MRLWCFDDVHQWGQSLVQVASGRGHEARLFDHAREPDAGLVFMHMHSHSAVRNQHKRLMAHLATIPALKLMPNYRLTVLHDDKIEQLRELARFMPTTRLFRTPHSAREYLEKCNPMYPIISKCSSGSGVRALRSIEDARREIKLAFSDIGLKNKHGQSEHGFLYWQEYCGFHEHVLRVIVMGRQRMLMRRSMASNGDDRPSVCLREETEEVRTAIEFSNEIVAATGFNFCALDLIQTHGVWRLLKVEVGWNMKSCAECMFFPDGRFGSSVWNVLMDEIEIYL